MRQKAARSKGVSSVMAGLWPGVRLGVQTPSRDPFAGLTRGAAHCRGEGDTGNGFTVWFYQPRRSDRCSDRQSPGASAPRAIGADWNFSRGHGG
jgi:hypothetical protein